MATVPIDEYAAKANMCWHEDNQYLRNRWKGLDEFVASLVAGQFLATNATAGRFAVRQPPDHCVKNNTISLYRQLRRRNALLKAGWNITRIIAAIETLRAIRSAAIRLLP